MQDVAKNENLYKFASMRRTAFRQHSRLGIDPNSPCYSSGDFNNVGSMYGTYGGLDSR